MFNIRRASRTTDSASMIHHFNPIQDGLLNDGGGQKGHPL